MSKLIRGKFPKTGNIEKLCVIGEGWVDKSKLIERINKGEKFNVNGTNVNVVPKYPKKGEYLRTDDNESLSDN